VAVIAARSRAAGLEPKGCWERGPARPKGADARRRPAWPKPAGPVGSAVPTSRWGLSSSGAQNQLWSVAQRSPSLLRPSVQHCPQAAGGCRPAVPKTNCGPSSSAAQACWAVGPAVPKTRRSVVPPRPNLLGRASRLEFLARPPVRGTSRFALASAIARVGPHALNGMHRLIKCRDATSAQPSRAPDRHPPTR
jgi:hypothetical protein